MAPRRSHDNSARAKLRAKLHTRLEKDKEPAQVEQPIEDPTATEDKMADSKEETPTWTPNDNRDSDDRPAKLVACVTRNCVAKELYLRHEMLCSVADRHRRVAAVQQELMRRGAKVKTLIQAEVDERCGVALLLSLSAHFARDFRLKVGREPACDELDRIISWCHTVASEIEYDDDELEIHAHSYNWILRLDDGCVYTAALHDRRFRRVLHAFGGVDHVCDAPLSLKSLLYLAADLGDAAAVTTLLARAEAEGTCTEALLDQEILIDLLRSPEVSDAWKTRPSSRLEDGDASDGDASDGDAADGDASDDALLDVRQVPTAPSANCPHLQDSGPN